MASSKKRKKAKKKTGRKGRRGASRKAEKKTKKRKARKSSKRSRAAKKAARTRMAKKEARRAAARKAARSRKRKGGGKRKARKSGKRKSAKRSAAARKGARTRKARKSGKRRSARRASPERIYKKALVEGNRHERAASRLRTQYEKALKANKNRSAAQVEKLRKQHERLKARLQYHEGMAAEARKRKGKRRGGKRRERNPIGSGGMHEYAAVGGGVLTAIALTIIPYRMIRSHALASGQDAPAQGDVPNLLTSQLPLWSRLKWKGAIALGVVLVGDIALPLFVASRIKTSDGWKTFFQLWGWTSVALAGSKLVVDTLALATKNTSLGQRLFAPENTARDVRAMSAAALLPPIAVAPGTGLPGLTGYGAAPQSQRHTGAAGCGCGDCEAKRKLANPNQPGTHQPITGTTPMPAQPGAVQPPGGNPLNPNTVVTGLPGNGVTAPGGNPLNPNTVVTGLPGNGVTAPGAAGAAGAAGAQVTPINKFQPKNRFDGKSRFGAQ
jgi:hypothetical protein